MQYSNASSGRPANHPVGAPQSRANPEPSILSHAGATLSLLCRMRSARCALPLSQIAETMRPMPITVLAGSPPHVLGMAVIRGNNVPVVDPGALLTPDEAAHATRFVIVNLPERQVALAVEEVVGIRPLPAESHRDLPPLLHAAHERAVAGIAMLDNQLLLILQTARLVPESTWHALQAAAT